jgi:F-type H+-transporting ATPase subunit delta
MREAIRGYASAVLEPLGDSELAEVGSSLASFASALATNVDLSDYLQDASLAVEVRSAIVADLLSDAPAAARGAVGIVVRSEEASELTGDVDWLVGRAADEPARRRGEIDPDPPAGQSAVNERLQGYALALFEQVADAEIIDEVEDDLFRTARILEGNRPLNDTLTNFDLPVSLRVDVITELLEGKAQPVTVALVSYAVRQTRGQLVSHLDWLSERVAEERGRRSASVTSAIELGAEQQSRLVDALSQLTGRRVNLKLDIDPSLIGGLRVVVGDTVLDGTVRRRLEEVGEVLVHGSRQRSGVEERRS